MSTLLIGVAGGGVKHLEITALEFGDPTQEAMLVGAEVEAPLARGNSLEGVLGNAVAEGHRLCKYHVLVCLGHDQGSFLHGLLPALIPPVGGILITALSEQVEDGERAHYLAGKAEFGDHLIPKVIDVGLVAGFVGQDDKGSDELLVGRVDGALYGAIEVFADFLDVKYDIR